MNSRWLVLSSAALFLTTTAANAVPPGQFCEALFPLDYAARLAAIAASARSTRQWGTYEADVRKSSSAVFASFDALVAQPGAVSASIKVTSTPGSPRHALFLTFEDRPTGASKALKKADPQDAATKQGGDYLLEVTRHGALGSLGVDIVVCHAQDKNHAIAPGHSHPVAMLNPGTQTLEDKSTVPTTGYAVDTRTGEQKYSTLLHCASPDNLLIYLLPQSPYRGGSFEVRLTRKTCKPSATTASTTPAPLACVDSP